MDLNTFSMSFDLNSNDDVDVTFDASETEKLIKHFQNGELNQYYLIIIEKILCNKSYSLERHEIITNLLPILTNIDLKDFSIVTDEQISRFAKIVGTFFSIGDIEEFGKTEF